MESYLKYPDVKSLLLVHNYDLSADMGSFMDICKNYRVTFIEVAAESLGITYNWKMTGSLGDYNIFSFNENKIITGFGSVGF